MHAWVLTRQGLQGSYFNMFMPTKQDLSQGVQLLTGERMQSDAATPHILSEEALRTVIVWNIRSSSAVKQALKGFNALLKAEAKTEVGVATHAP